ncbi:GNAT family N-acetyltransferase [Prosthecobacter debontii]|nr:GNAT family N-acetyltransferase [Prosthecobacter debontii]
MIRSATTSDARSIAEIHVSAWRAAYQGILPEGYLNRFSVEKREQIWKGACEQDDSDLLVATTRSEVVGFCHLTPSRDQDSEDAGEITSIYLAPEQKRRGLGRALVEASLALASAQGFERITLWVLVENLPARQFYEALGFRPDGMLKEETDGDVCLREMRYQIRVNEALQRTLIPTSVLASA